MMKILLLCSFLKHLFKTLARSPVQKLAAVETTNCTGDREDVEDTHPLRLCSRDRAVHLRPPRVNPHHWQTGRPFQKNMYIFNVSKNAFILHKSNKNDKKILFYKIAFQTFHIYSWTLPQIKKKLLCPRSVELYLWFPFLDCFLGESLL